MNIAMTGATGYIGKHLSNYLTEKGGHRIIPLGRSMFREGGFTALNKMEVLSTASRARVSTISSVMNSNPLR